MNSSTKNIISDRLTIEEHNSKPIVMVNYKGLKEKEMIELITLHLQLSLDRKLPWLADFHKTYATPGYLSHAKRFIELTKDIIDKGAFLGIDNIKAWILKGVVMTYGVNYKAFDTKTQAIEFLTTDQQQTK